MNEFQLNKDEQAQIMQFSAKVTDAAAALVLAQETFNSAIENARAALLDEIDKWNDLAAEIGEFAEDVVSAAQDSFDNKSERWQEGERGVAARSFIDAWTEIKDSFVPLEIDVPDCIAVVDPSESIPPLEDAPTWLDL